MQRQCKGLLVFMMCVFSMNHAYANETWVMKNAKLVEACMQPGTDGDLFAHSWRFFENGCGDYCFAGDKAERTCTELAIMSCDCGEDACWDGERCVDNSEFEIKD